MRTLILAGLVLLVVVAGGLTTLALSDMKPSPQKVEQEIPDDRLPH